MAESSFEELEQPRPTRMPIRVLTAIAVVVVVTLGVIRIVSAPTPRLPVAMAPMDHVAPPLPIRVAMPPVEQPSVDPLGRTRFVPYRPARACPRATDGQNACSTYHGVSTAFLRAVRARCPQLVVRTAVTQMLRASDPHSQTGIWSVQFRATVGAAQLRIAIDRAEPEDRTSVITTNGRSRSKGAFIFDRYVVGRYAIQLEARAARMRQLPNVWKLAELARDRRLVRPPAATMVR